MDNLYEEFWIEEPKKTHEYEIGTYHVSQVGVNHSDLEYDEHSGPCLRQGFLEYKEPKEQSNGTIGNFHIGNILHAEVQRIAKINNPAVINEFPLRMWIRDNLIISGSVDTVIFAKDGVSVIDFKTASNYTLPKGDFDKNPTHFAQVYIYAHILHNHVFCSGWNVKDVSVAYINKHNLETFRQTEKFDGDKSLDLFNDFVERCMYLDTCLKNDDLPVPEPMKWCKYCKYLDFCVDDGGVEVIENRGKIQGLKVVD
jgi:hypothetical protein